MSEQPNEKPAFNPTELVESVSQIEDAQERKQQLQERLDASATTMEELNALADTISEDEELQANAELVQEYKEAIELRMEQLEFDRGLEGLEEHAALAEMLGENKAPEEKEWYEIAGEQTLKYAKMPIDFVASGLSTVFGKAFSSSFAKSIYKAFNSGAVARYAKIGFGYMLRSPQALGIPAFLGITDFAEQLIAKNTAIGTLLSAAKQKGAKFDGEFDEQTWIEWGEEIQKSGPKQKKIMYDYIDEQVAAGKKAKDLVINMKDLRSPEERQKLREEQEKKDEQQLLVDIAEATPDVTSVTLGSPAKATRSGNEWSLTIAKADIDAEATTLKANTTATKLLRVAKNISTASEVQFDTAAVGSAERGGSGVRVKVHPEQADNTSVTTLLRQFGEMPSFIKNVRIPEGFSVTKGAVQFNPSSGELLVSNFEDAIAHITEHYAELEDHLGDSSTTEWKWENGDWTKLDT